jgi:hypothetical protein
MICPHIEAMQQEYLDDAAIQAYLKLIELNMGSWRPEISDWLHSDESRPALGRLLAIVPCPPTLH